MLIAGAWIGRQARPRSYHLRPRHPFLNKNGRLGVLIEVKRDGKRNEMGWKIAVLRCGDCFSIEGDGIEVLAEISFAGCVEVLVRVFW